ncbi:hypothetical protein AAFF_G00387380, partial [Aldrovandia affinis]
MLRKCTKRTYVDAIAIPHGTAETAGSHHAEDVQQGHEGAPSVLRGRLALHAREAPVGTATCQKKHSQKKLLIFL